MTLRGNKHVYVTCISRGAGKSLLHFFLIDYLVDCYTKNNMYMKKYLSKVLLFFREAKSQTFNT